MEHPDLPGWRVAAERFDMGTKWGVAVDNGLSGPARRRHAVRVPDGTMPLEQAVEWAMPTLKKWALGE